MTKTKDLLLNLKNFEKAEITPKSLIKKEIKTISQTPVEMDENLLEIQLLIDQQKKLLERISTEAKQESYIREIIALQKVIVDTIKAYEGLKREQASEKADESTLFDSLHQEFLQLVQFISSHKCNTSNSQDLKEQIKKHLIENQIPN